MSNQYPSDIDVLERESRAAFAKRLRELADRVEGRDPIRVEVLGGGSTRSYGRVGVWQIKVSPTSPRQRPTR